MLWLLGFLKGVPVWKLTVWFCSTLAGGSTINPDFLRGFGIGTWNGSLWTISVELSFYLFLPVAYLLFGSRKRLLNGILWLGLGSSFALFLAYDGLVWGETKSAGFLSKVVWFSLPGNLWMFLFGTLAHRYFAQMRGALEGKLGVWLIVMLILSYLPHSKWPAWASASHLFCSRLLLAGVALSAAFSGRSVAGRLLHGQDLSYGLYLSHAPIFNLFCHLGLRGSWSWWLLASGLALIAAALSWRVVEKPALALKGRFFKQTLKPRHRGIEASRVGSATG